MGMLVIRKDGSQGKVDSATGQMLALAELSRDTNGTNPHIVDLVALILVVRIPDMFEQGKSSVARGAFINMDSC